MASPDRPGIAITDLLVRRRGSVVLDEVSLDIPAGVIFGLLGPSGSGKTTLMRAMMGLQRITSGSISVLGAEAGDRRLGSKVGYMPQAAALYGDLTVLENLRYFARLVNQPRARVAEVLEEVDMVPFTKARVDRLSGGQRARVSLAVALLPRPEVLILDEPTVGLDPLLRERLWGEFRAKASAGATVIVSSHVMEEASRCDELVLLREGRVVAAGSPASLLERAGASDLNAAFIALVQQAEREAA